MWALIHHRLGIDQLIEHAHRQEKNMGKLSDELEDIGRRVNAMREAQTASSGNVRDALTRLEQKVDELANGDLSQENQAKVDAIKVELDNAKTAAEGIDDGYEPPVVEPSPFPPSDDGSVAGSVDARTVDTSTDTTASTKSSKSGR
jgi:hypothetical protein